MSDDDTTAIAKPAALDRWLTKTRDMLTKLGVPEAAIRALPAFAILFGATAIPAAGVAVISMFTSSFYAAWKQHTFQQAIRQELHGAVGEVEAEAEDVRQAVENLEESVEDVRAEARAMASMLSPEQVEQLGAIFEQYMSTLDSDWLKHLRRAARGVVKRDIEAGTRKAVLAHLRMLAPVHIAGLAALSGKCGDNSV